MKNLSIKHLEDAVDYLKGIGILALKDEQYGFVDETVQYLKDIDYIIVSLKEEEENGN